MAISFYKARDSADLADKLAAILQSPSQQRAAAEHNFSAAMRMTMPSVVRQYLRWFELAQHKQTVSGFAKFSLLPFWHSSSRDLTSLRRSSRASWDWTLRQSPADGESGGNSHDPADGARIIQP
jgi:hypothetical protein